MTSCSVTSCSSFIASCSPFIASFSSFTVFFIFIIVGVGVIRETLVIGWRIFGVNLVGPVLGDLGWLLHPF